MKYEHLGGHTPGSCSVTIQDGEATIITPGQPPVTSKLPVTTDEIEYFHALFRLGDFFNAPVSPPASTRRIRDLPNRMLTLTDGQRSHAADCVRTQNPYLDALLKLFEGIVTKQAMILQTEAVIAGRKPLERLPRFEQWHTPLRSQQKRAARLLNGLLEHNSVAALGHDNPGGDTNPIPALATAHTVDILSAKLRTQNPTDLSIVDALGSSGDPRAIPLLLNLLAKGNDDPRIVRALARLDCRAVLDEALRQRNLEAVGYLGHDDPRAVAMVESEAFGWFTNRHRRSEAVKALARMGRLPTPTKAGLFAHVLAVLLILVAGIPLLAPRAVSRLLARSRRLWLTAIGLGGILTGGGILYMLHFSYFF
jgi:hypothetical protein